MSALNKDFIVIETNGQSEIQNIPVSGYYSYFAAGDFDNGVLSLEVSPNGLDWFVASQLSSSGRLIIFLSSGEKIRLDLQGSNNLAEIRAGIRQ